MLEKSKLVMEFRFMTNPIVFATRLVEVVVVVVVIRP
jgi:hypothetical protein